MLDARLQAERGIERDRLGPARSAAETERTFSNDPAGHRDLAAWARRVAPDGVVGVEGSASYGAAAARFMLSEEFTVARSRLSSRVESGSGRGELE